MTDNACDERLDEIERGLFWCMIALRRYRAARHVEPSSAGDLHVRLTGHRIAPGCCATHEGMDDVEGQAWAEEKIRAA